MQATLEKNLKDNSSLPETEIVVLDYNSDDQPLKWLTEKFPRELETGKIVYFRTEENNYFHRSHSRNMAIRLSRGQIICNLDADNFTGEGFSKYLYDNLTHSNSAFISAKNSGTDFLGRIAMQRKQFEAVSGYDERMNGYGFEDLDLINRLTQSGYNNIQIADNQYLSAITHDDEERVKEEKGFVEIEHIFIKHLTHSRSDIIFLYKSGNFKRGTLIDQETEQSDLWLTRAGARFTGYQYDLVQQIWLEGQWYDDLHGQLKFVTGKLKAPVTFDWDQVTIRSETEEFFKLTDKDLIINLVIFESQLTNRRILKENMRNPGIFHQGSYGCGKVYDIYSNEIYL